ncbi:MAG TPA: hypothetical protein VHM26_01890 [Chitinophagaceae bacterium]|jgi:hypothetical protein|nr:hypothetical protein [Chitinophagaceae bacterium]
MRKYILLLIVCVFSYTADAVSIPSSPIDPTAANITPAKMDPSKLKARDIEQMIGRRLTLKERIVWVLVKRQFKKNPVAKADFDINKKARTAKILGIISLIALFTPFAIAAIPLAIIAITSGAKVKRIDPENRDAKRAITFGTITLAVCLAMILIVLAIVSAFVIRE